MCLNIYIYIHIYIFIYISIYTYVDLVDGVVVDRVVVDRLEEVALADGTLDRPSGFGFRVSGLLLSV